MATKSILKDITIRNNKSARNFASAMEKLQSVERNKVEMKRDVRELNREQIRKILGK